MSVRFLSDILSGSRYTPNNVTVMERSAVYDHVYSVVFYMDGDESKMYKITGIWVAHNNAFTFMDAEPVAGSSDLLCREVEPYEETTTRYRYKK